MACATCCLCVRRGESAGEKTEELYTTQSHFLFGQRNFILYLPAALPAPGTRSFHDSNNYESIVLAWEGASTPHKLGRRQAVLTMPLDEQTLLDLRAEYFADDIEILPQMQDGLLKKRANSLKIHPWTWQRAQCHQMLH